jgi:hypothetical protein
MQVASRRPPGSAYPGNGLPNIDEVTAADGNGLEMVVGGDESVAVIDLNPVAAAPWMPSGGTDHA